MSLIKNSVSLFVLVFLVTAVTGQKIAWTPIESLEDSMQLKKKPVIIKLETSWCGYCKMMEARVFSNKRVVKRLRDNYYFVKLDGESRKSITLNGEKYDYIMYSAQTGIHQLVKKLGEERGQVNYPTTVVLNTDYSLNKRIVGYVSRNNFLYWLESSDD